MDNKSTLVQVSTYLRTDSPEFAALLAEAKDRAVSRSKVLHWAILERYEKQLQEARSNDPR